jgi:hypothetical protein
VLSGPFDAIARSMTGGNQLLAVAASIPTHVFSGPGIMARSMHELHLDTSGPATHSCTTRPITGTRIPQTSRSLSRSSMTTAGTVPLRFLGDGAVPPPHGARGGDTGIAALQEIRGASGEHEPMGVRSRQIVRDGQTLVSRCNGGGYGDPLQREPEHVLNDIRGGFVTPERAADVHVVAIGAELAHEVAATARLRAEVQLHNGGAE